MEVIKTAIEGVVIIEPKVFKDAEAISSKVFLNENLMRKLLFLSMENLSSSFMTTRA